MTTVQAFEVVDARLQGPPGVAVRGEIDVSAVASLGPILDAAIRDAAGAFVLDLCDLEFLDSSGLSLLLRARALLAREDRALAIVCPPGPVRRLIELIGIADLLFLYASREDAAAALVQPRAPAPTISASASRSRTTRIRRHAPREGRGSLSELFLPARTSSAANRRRRKRLGTLDRRARRRRRWRGTR